MSEEHKNYEFRYGLTFNLKEDDGDYQKVKKEIINKLSDVLDDLDPNKYVELRVKLYADNPDAGYI